MLPVTQERTMFKSTLVVLASFSVPFGAMAGSITEPYPDHLSLVRAAWPTLASDECDPAFGLFLEANGLAAAVLLCFVSV